MAQARCPNSTLKEFGHFAFEAYAFFKNYQVLPDFGGMLDQSKYFLNVVKFCDKVSSVNEKRRKEQEEFIRKASEKLQNKKGR